MLSRTVSRRQFFNRSAVGAGAALALAPAPALSAAEAAGIKASDLAIKEVKAYVLKSANRRDGEQRIASIVTNCGIEGNYTLASKYFHPNWSNLGWLDYAREVLRFPCMMFPRARPMLSILPTFPCRHPCRCSSWRPMVK